MTTAYRWVNLGKCKELCEELRETRQRWTSTLASESGSRRAHFRKANIGRLETETQAENLSALAFRFMAQSVPELFMVTRVSSTVSAADRGNSIKVRCDDANHLPLLSGIVYLGVGLVLLGQSVMLDRRIGETRYLHQRCMRHKTKYFAALIPSDWKLCAS